jgi:hypothetical protein
MLPGSLATGCFEVFSDGTVIAGEPNELYSSFEERFKAERQRQKRKAANDNAHSSAAIRSESAERLRLGSPRTVYLA